MSFISLNICLKRRIASLTNSIIMSKQKSEKKPKLKVPVIPSIIELVAIGGGRGGTCRSLIVNMTHFKYMFNCGEGTQRIATEHKRLKHTSHIFVTSGSWQNIGGLMGLCLTLDSAEVKCLQVYGPPAMEKYITTSRDFSKLNGLELLKKDILDGSYEDSAMKITFVPIHKQLKDDNKKIKIDKSTDIEMAIVYICKPHTKPRCVSLDLCAQHDVPIGPHLQLLKDGKEVFLSTINKLIKPDDVLLPEEPSHSFLVVECPTTDYLDDLINNQSILLFKNTESLNLGVIVHFTPSAVMQDQRYSDWMSSFGSTVEHLILNDFSDDLDSEAIHRYQTQLHQLHPTIFPHLYHQSHSHHNEMKSIDSSQNVKYMKTNMKYVIRPHVKEKLTSEACINLQFDEEKNNILNNDDVQKLIKNLKPDKDNDKLYPEILFLGTGSAVPNKYRNVSSILLNMSSDSSMLLDCGENAYGQLYRHIGPTQIIEKMKHLKCVFISHLHADHHMGLIGLALARQEILMKEGVKFEPLIVLAPGALSQWYSEIHNSMLPLLDIVKIIPLEQILYNLTNKNLNDHFEELLKSCGLSKMNSVRVNHRQCPHGVVLEHTSGWKLVYSGDTMPCDALITAGKNCDILIHEATFDDQKLDEAKEKRHSTTSQAIEAGIKMSAKYTILTHFSQRYDKLPIITKDFTENVGVSFDNMKVRYCDLSILPQLIPVLMLAFADDYKQMLEIQSVKYLRKKMFTADDDETRESKTQKLSI